MAGFVFYDTETTGLRRGFDQIVHFAAIRTDQDLNETARFEARCQLQPHVVPHPKALLTNGLPISRLQDPALPTHYQMVCSIRRQLEAWGQAIYVGYNSIGFDEHMLRHAFFQSLHDPYLTSTPGSGRADALGLALTASALPPHSVRAPKGENGRPVFKLARIAEANGLVHATAHDAVSDTEATLALCRLVRDQDDDAWQRFVRFSTKAAVDQFIEAEDGFVLTQFFGNEAYHRVVACLGRELGNANGRFCIDLAIDPGEWAAMSDEEMGAAIGRRASPMRRLAVNGAPTLTAIWDAPADLLCGLEAEVAEDRARRLRQDPALCARLIKVYTASWTDDEPSPHPEERLYGIFAGDADKARMFDFHEAGRQGRLNIVEEFEDPRLQVFGRRLIHSEHRSWLDETSRLEADLDLARRLSEDRGGQRTLGQALAALDELVVAQAEDPHELLTSYRVWLLERMARVDDFLLHHAAA